MLRISLKQYWLYGEYWVSHVDNTGGCGSYGVVPVTILAIRGVLGILLSQYWRYGEYWILFADNTGGYGNTGCLSPHNTDNTGSTVLVIFRHHTANTGSTGYSSITILVVLELASIRYGMLGTYGIR